MFLFLPFEGQFKLSPCSTVCISDAEMCACDTVNGSRVGVKVFLSSTLNSDLFFLLKYKLPCLFKSEVWAVLISTSGLKPFHIQMNIKCL